MNRIVIGFSRPKGWFEPFSWLIRLAYWSSFSHTYIKLHFTEFNTDIIIQASGLKVNLISKEEFESQEIICKEFIIPITNRNKKQLIKFSLNQLGKPYNISGIFGMAWVRLGQLIGFKFNNPFNYNGSSYFCSQLVGYILENYEDLDLGNISNLSPLDVYNIILKVK